MYYYFYNKYKNFVDLVTKHPNENNMNYITHFNHAISMSYKLAHASVSVFIHAFYPPIHEKTASTIIKDLYLQNLEREIKRN